MFVLANMWFQTLMRQFFFNIDKIVFNFISIIYDFLISIARTSILSQADILDMTGRIYKLLAVFMIFKVTFSLIMYVVNPDDFSDKTKGVGKLGTNIIISLALLILTPYIFSYAYQLQTIILEDNALSALIFGDENDPANESAFNTAGDSMAYITMSPFFTPNTALDELYECSELTTKDGEKTKINEECFGLTSEFYEPLDDNESLYALTEDDKNTDFTQQTLVNYAAGIENGNLGLMFRQDMAIAKTPKGEDYIIDYKYIFSTVTGVVVILLLLTFCLDVALRSIKLAFLQLIAPIPIISYVDPKSGKDGMFKKWYEMCFKTYISLFIRLLAIYFVAYIVSRLDKMVDIIDGSYITSAIVKIFVIIGALMFAKQLPKILEGLGIKLDGGFTLNPLRKIEKEALGGGMLKKPNDFLGKTAKGIVKAPVTAMATGGKKGVAALYSAANGRGLRRGWKSVDSPFKKALNKKIDEWAPDFAKDRQEARVAKLDAEEQRRTSNKVSKYFSGDRKAGKRQFENKLAATDSKYAQLYKDAETKKGQMYDTQARADRWLSRIRNGEITASQRAELAKNLNIRDKDGNIDVNASDDKLIKGLNKASGTAEKVYKKVEEQKELYGKTSPSARRAAALEKAYDSYDKLNPEIGAGAIPEYRSDEEIKKTNESVNKDSSADEVSNNSNRVISETEKVENFEKGAESQSTQNVQQRIDDMVGINDTSTVEMGAYDDEDSALRNIFDLNTSDEEKKRREEIWNRMEKISKEVEKLIQERKTVTSGEEFQKITEKINQLKEALENLRSQL